MLTINRLKILVRHQRFTIGKVLSDYIIPTVGYSLGNHHTWLVQLYSHLRQVCCECWLYICWVDGNEAILLKLLKN